MQIIARMLFTMDKTNYNVIIYHKRYKRKNNYKILKEGKIFCRGECEKSKTAYDIFNFSVIGFNRP